MAKVFGVASEMPTTRISDDLAMITQVDVATERVEPNQSFAIDALRTERQPYTSKEIEIVVGDVVLKTLSRKGVYVDLTYPDKTIYVVPMGAIMQEIVKRVHPKLVYLCCKRMMYRLGGLLAKNWCG